jgi:hypothetical protein
MVHFDPAILPTLEAIPLSIDALPKQCEKAEDVTVALWNKPADGELFRIIEVGGATLARDPVFDIGGGE